MSVLYLILLLIAIATNTLLIVTLFYRKERSLTLACFILFLALILVWAVPQFFLNFFLIEGEFYSHMDRISAFGYTFLPVAFLLFTISFGSYSYLLRKYSFLLWVIIPPSVFLYLSWTTSLVESHNYQNVLVNSWGLASPPGPLFLSFLAWFEFLMLASLYILVKVYRGSSSLTQKKQSIWLIVATLIPLSIGTITDGILPALGNAVMPLAIPLTSIMSIMITYAILKYELFEFSPTNIISSMGDGLVSIDKSGKVIYVNEAAEVLSGLKKKNLLGKQFYKIVKLFDSNGNEVPPEKRPSAVAIEEGRKISTRDFVVKVGKKKFSAAYTVSPVLDGKKVIGATINFTDITEEKEIERNKDEFISVASHELKTPITALKLYTQMLENQLGREANTKYLPSISRINSQTDKLVTMVSDLLNLSRIQTGKFAYKKEPIKVDFLIKDSIQNVKPAVKGRKIEVLGVVKDLVLADQDKISQVLTNLIVNAHKYSPTDKKISVRVKKIKDNVLIAVKDFGPGIPKSLHKKIFERYYQGKGSSGLGVGLYVSKEIIENHNGKIWVEGEKGKGSTFIFSLPIYHKINVNEGLKKTI